MHPHTHSQGTASSGGGQSGGNRRSISREFNFRFDWSTPVRHVALVSAAARGDSRGLRAIVVLRRAGLMHVLRCEPDRAGRGYDTRHEEVRGHPDSQRKHADQEGTCRAKTRVSVNAAHSWECGCPARLGGK